MERSVFDRYAGWIKKYTGDGAPEINEISGTISFKGAGISTGAQYLQDEINAHPDEDIDRVIRRAACKQAAAAASVPVEMLDADMADSADEHAEARRARLASVGALRGDDLDPEAGEAALDEAIERKPPAITVTAPEDNAAPAQPVADLAEAE